MANKLPNDKAIKEIKRIMRYGNIRYSKKHFWKRQKGRKIDLQDVRTVIRGGFIEKDSEPEYDKKRDVYKYRVWGHCGTDNICVVVGLYIEEDAIEPITVWRT